MNEAIRIVVNRDLIASELGDMMPEFAFEVLKSTSDPEVESTTEMLVNDEVTRLAMVAWKAEGSHLGELKGIHPTGNQLQVLGVTYVDYSGVDSSVLNAVLGDPDAPLEGFRVVRMIDWASLHAQVGFSLGRQIVPSALPA